MQEHEYKARDKTVQKMSRDGLREENLRNKEEKRITGRDTDTEISRSEKKEELDFSKRRHERLKEEREMEQPEQSSRKPRYSREHVSDQDINSDMGEEVEIEGDISVENGENPKSQWQRCCYRLPDTPLQTFAMIHPDSIQPASPQWQTGIHRPRHVRYMPVLPPGSAFWPLSQSTV